MNTLKFLIVNLLLIIKIHIDKPIGENKSLKKNLLAVIAYSITMVI